MLYGISNPDAAAAGKYFGDYANEQQLPVGIRHIEGADHNFSSVPGASSSMPKSARSSTTLPNDLGNQLSCPQMTNNPNTYPAFDIFKITRILYMFRHVLHEQEMIMPMVKLTLTAPPEVVSMAEEQAKSENTSISAMFVNFVLAKARLKTQRHSRIKIGPLTKSVTGIVKLPDDFDEKEFMGLALEEKFGLEQ